MDSIFDNSDLPKKVDQGLVNALLIYIRKEFYNIKQDYTTLEVRFDS